MLLLHFLLTYLLADDCVSMPKVEKINPHHLLNDLWRMNQHPNNASHLHQHHKLNCNGIVIEKIIKCFKGLWYLYSLSCLCCCAKWLVCTICMERQSSSYRMKAHVERCCGIIDKSKETWDKNVYTSSWSKQSIMSWSQHHLLGFSMRMNVSLANLSWNVLNLSGYWSSVHPESQCKNLHPSFAHWHHSLCSYLSKPMGLWRQEEKNSH